MSTQAILPETAQPVSPAGQPATQAPLAQAMGQVASQSPHAKGSLFRSRQLPVHATAGGRHLQFGPESSRQYWSSLHLVPQAPQLSGSPATSTHSPPQVVPLA